MKTRKWIGCLCIVAMVICMAGCSKEDSKETSSAESSSVEESQNKTTDLTETYAAYQNLLEEKKDAIQGYSWQRAVSSDVKYIQRPVALCDINGDGIPELFCMMAEEKYQAVLRIYTYENDQVKEMTYTLDDSDEPLWDVEAGAGVNYVVYADNDGNLYIYHTSGSDSITYCVNTYQAKGSTLKATGTLKNVYGPSEDNSDEISDVYYLNGKKIGNSQGKLRFQNVFKKMESVILYSGYDETSIWSRFDTEKAKCMSLTDLQKELEKGTDN